MANKHTIETIISDIKIRLEKAQATHKAERELERPDIRTKESAWGKMVAYAHCLRLATELDFGMTKKAVTELLQEIDSEKWTQSREIKAITKAYKMIRKKEDEIAALWQYHIGAVESIENKTTDEVHNKIMSQWENDFGSIHSEQKMDAYTVSGFVQSALAKNLSFTSTEPQSKD